MNFYRAQSDTKPQDTYFYRVGGYYGLLMYGLLALVLVGGLSGSGFDSGSASSLLLFPLVLGLATVAGLLFQLAGAIVASVLIFLLSGYGCLSGAGVFQSLAGAQAAYLWLGFSALAASSSLIGALCVGYSRRTEEMAVQRQNLLYKIFDALPIGIWVRARDGRSIFVNERWAGFSPQSARQILTSGSMVPPVDLGPEWSREVEEVLESSHSAVRYRSIELADQAGRVSNMTLLTLRMLIDQEDDYGTLSLLVDETALRIYEKKVQESEQNLHMALYNARMGFWDENVQTKDVRCDENWYHLIQASRASGESPLQIWQARLHPDDRARVHEAYQEYYRAGEGPLRLDYRMRKGDQGYIWVQDSVRIADYDDSGKPLRVMGTMQDISEQKQAELELKQAKEFAETGNQAKSQFIATISHEIRTPLNAIIGLSSFLAEGELEGEQQDLAQTIYSSGKSLLFLVNDILDFSKIEAGRLDLEVQEFPLLLCFEDCVRLFRLRANEKNVELLLDLSPQLPEFAAGDMERLRQIVQNLLANALKFTDAGEVKVSARPVTLSDLDEAQRPDPLQPIGYLDRSDHEYLEVRIEDTGIGIPEDRQHVLFEAFSQVDASTTRKYGGTGLGLVICKRLVDAMGGRIWVESEEGKGAAFCFVVRTKFIGAHGEMERLTRTPFDPVQRIAEQHPCDILVVGPEDESRALILSCRKLGYAPHFTEDYDLSGDAYRRRHYNIMFIWMEDELKALELSRKLSSAGHMLKPDTIIGCAPETQKLSVERIRLSGIQSVVQDKLRPLLIRDVILRVLGALDSPR